MTHCHSGSVVKVMQEARNRGTKFEVINTETRPLYQGRITAQDMLHIGIPTTLITDDMAPYYIDRTINDTPKVDMFIIGCDAIKPNGNVINKVGSFGIALSAYNSGIPVYVVGSLTKYDAEDKIAIELRDGAEVWPEAPRGLNIVNFAFDTVPAKFITGIISRYGVIQTQQLPDIVAKNYPRMQTKINTL